MPLERPTLEAVRRTAERTLGEQGHTMDAWTEFPATGERRTFYTRSQCLRCLAFTWVRAKEDKTGFAWDGGPGPCRPVAAQ